MIKIEVEKVVIRGEKSYKILDLEALEKEALPIQYTDEKDGPGFWKREDEFLGRRSYLGNSWYGFFVTYFKVGETYVEGDFNIRLEYIRQCGDRLKRINQKLKEENAGWTGTHTFII